MYRRIQALWVPSLVISTQLLQGCIDSPLLNHQDAIEQRYAAESECPLSFPSQNLCASLTWVKLPGETEMGVMDLRFWDATTGGASSGPYKAPAQTPWVKLWMPAMGHGSSPVQIIPAQNTAHEPVAGVFDVKDVYFIMPGKWELWVQLKQDGHVIEQAKLDVEI